LKSGQRLIFNEFFKDFPISCHGNKSFAWNLILLAIFRKDHQRTLLPIYNEIQPVISDKMNFEDFAIDI